MNHKATDKKIRQALADGVKVDISEESSFEKDAKERMSPAIEKDEKIMASLKVPPNKKKDNKDFKHYLDKAKGQR